ncbi:hypothetical protein [Ectobacillus ponti]|uniref:Uncharacterized protein n=1 Tax=Ectobacillus ponti TaxID=2961894 RepID=A0AA42BPM6_9BACI|nr:hypothetical protein [Ectobacillus ponti]MCP8968907.1 hypothetical protein [Ectobacillus ponti]
MRLSAALLRHASLSFCFIIFFSPVCSVVFTGTSYTAALSSVLQQLLQPQTILFPSSHWIREPFFFSNVRAVDLTAQFSFHDKTTFLFPYIWLPYLLSVSRFAAALLVGLLLSMLLMVCCFAVKPGPVLRFLPTVPLTAGLQLLLLLLTMQWHMPKLPAQLFIILAASLVLPLECVNLWLQKDGIPPSSFLQAIRLPFALLLRHWKPLCFAVWISASLFEYMLNTDGLITFLMQYILLSPSVVAVSLLLLYMPYLLLNMLLLQSGHRKEFSERTANELPL